MSERIDEIKNRTANECSGYWCEPIDGNGYYAIDQISEDFVHLLTELDRLKAERLTAVTAALEAAAKMADAYAEANIELAQDTILTDPMLRGDPVTPESVAVTERKIVDGCIHSSMFHAAQNIAEAIRSLSPQAILDQMGGE